MNLPYLIYLFPVIMGLYLLLLKYFNVNFSVGNIILFILGYIGFYQLLSSLLQKNDARAFWTFIIFIIGFLIFGLIINIGIQKISVEITGPIFAAVLMVAVPGFVLLGATKITPVYNQKQLYESHVRSPEEFQELKDKYKISRYLYFLLGLFFIYAGYMGVSSISKSTAIGILIITLAACIYLCIRVGGISNYMISHSHLWSNINNFSEFER